VIASVDIKIDEEGFGNGKKRWYRLNSGGKIMVAFGCKTLDNPPPLTWGIEVISCSGLPNLATFGEQDPYVKAVLLPGKTTSGRSVAAVGGGVAPSWNPSAIIALSKEEVVEGVLLEVRLRCTAG
jgi:hypothetical protein